MQEAEESIRYYEQRKIGLGDSFAVLLSQSLEKIKVRPEGFSLLETLPAELGYRRLRMQQFPFLVVFRLSQELIEIIAIAHTSREPNYWLDQDRK
jgi:hypothetical protein